MDVQICSESNVWTRWRCRRCYNSIPAGLHGKHGQAVAAKSGEWSTGSPASSGEEDRKARCLEAENKELRARIDAMEKKEGVQKGPGIPFKEEGDGEIAWKSRMRPSVAENWMNRGEDAEGATRGRQIVLRFQGSAGEPQDVTAAPVARCGEKEE